MPSLNGTTVYPSDIEAELIVIGDEIEAANGVITHMVRGSKWRWTITWNRVSSAVRTTVRTIAQISTPFTWVDEDGTSYTVLRDLTPYSAKKSLITRDGTVYYDVTLTIRQE